ERNCIQEKPQKRGWQQCFDHSWASSVRHRRHGAPVSPLSQCPTMPEALMSPGGAVPAAPSTQSRAVVVLGVGRSGTSPVTRGLGALGVELGDRLRRATRLKNPTGFYEDTDLLRINKRLKRILGVRGESVRLLEPDWWKQAPVERLHDDAVGIVRRRFG